MQRFLSVFLLGFALTAQAQNSTPVEQQNNGSVTKNVIITNTNGAFNSNNVNVLNAEYDTVHLEIPVSIQTEELEETRSLRKEKAVITPSAKKSQESAPMKESQELLQKSEADTPAASSQAVRMQQQFEMNQSSSSRQYSRRSASGVEQMNMDNSVTYYKQALPNSFESHFFAYLAGHYNTALYPELEAAAEIRPEDTEVRKQLAAYHIINNDAEQALPIIRELIDTGAVSSGQLLYANDLLLSGDSAAVLVLHGFDDMFATYFVQNNNDVRTDVRLLSLDFMQSATYRSNWTNEAFNLPESETIDTAYLAELCRLNSDKKLQLSMTIPKDYFTGIKKNLYPEGLTFLYSEWPADRFQRNYSLWSAQMNLRLIDHPSNDNGDNWCTNYLPMLVTLRKQLAAVGLKEEVKKLDGQILLIGSRTNNTDKVKKYTK